MAQSESGTAAGALPVELTHFVGRERELAALRGIAADARLLTLTGAGGSGKSRLALQLVRDMARSDGATAWVELAPLLDEALVPGAILRALGAPSEGGAATAATVADSIRDRTITLVLDNCEHLIDSCALIADSLLRACPHLQILATSREALGVAGERAWLVPPLQTAASDAPLATLEKSDAIRLFVDRARDVLPDFQLNAQNARTVADICTRLDGIPLAIELAAARVRHMSPDQIRERLADAFALLTTGPRTALPRHRTLRATLDWSHDLLPSDARVVLRRLAVFRGGFTLDMVERVVSDDAVAAADLLDVIALLADRSLIVVREHDGVARYQLLETMRQYASLHLEAAGEAEAVRTRHAEAVAEFVFDAEPAFTRRERMAAFRRLHAELDNIREALTFTRTSAPALHVRLVGALWWFWFSTRHWVEAQRWISEALALPAAAGKTYERGALLFALGALECLRADMPTARPLLEEAIDVARTVGDERLEAYALNYMAMSWAASLSPDALQYAMAAERWMRANGDEYGLRLALLLGGMALHGAGRSDEAIAKMEEAVAIARSFGQDRELAVALQTYGTVLFALDQEDRAHSMAVESLRALRRDSSFLFIARAIDYCAVGRAPQAPADAARVIGIGEAVRRHIAAKRFQHDQDRVGALITSLRERLGDAAYDAAFNSGLEVQPARAADEVLKLYDVADGAAPGESSAPMKPAAQASAPTSSAPAADEQVDLAVRLLGPFELTVRGERVAQWPYAKPRELLSYLLLHPQGRTRIEIGEALWPGAAPSQVRNSFHVTMHHLRRTLGRADWVMLEGERYRLAPQLTVWTDVNEFRARAEAALSNDAAFNATDLRAVLALYRDHLLADDSAGPWRDDLQDRLRRLYCELGMKLGLLLERADDAAGAAAVYEKVVAAEPLHEQAHRGLLLSLTRAGNRPHALRHYERLKAVLEQIELEPEPETEELYERIRTADIVPGP